MHRSTKKDRDQLIHCLCLCSRISTRIVLNIVRRVQRWVWKCEGHEHDKFGWALETEASRKLEVCLRRISSLLWNRCDCGQCWLGQRKFNEFVIRASMLLIPPESNHFNAALCKHKFSISLCAISPADFQELPPRKPSLPPILTNSL